MNIVEVENLTYRVENITICKEMTMHFPKHAFTGIIGANGSGKSTLLKQIYRMLKPSTGCVYLNGKDIKLFSSKHIARQMAVLPQENQSDFDYTVGDVVLMGRYPYHGFFDAHRSDREDRNIMKKYLRLLGLDGQEERYFKTLSGGEKQRVLLARALSQETELIVLDEVTNHLDIGYQYKILQILRDLNLTIISAIHDLNLAMKFCDYVVLIDQGSVLSSGAPREVITEEVLKRVFHMDAKIIERENGAVIDYIRSSC